MSLLKIEAVVKREETGDKRETRENTEESREQRAESREQRVLEMTRRKSWVVPTASP